MKRRVKNEGEGRERREEREGKKEEMKSPGLPVTFNPLYIQIIALNVTVHMN